MPKKVEEEVYRLTFKGLLSLTINDDKKLEETINSIELYLRRHYAKEGHPAIVLDMDENEFSFATLKK